ncbi:MAG: rRNA methyltransferase [Alphaproteobacteria bacterium]|nr:rRNA methyltransferase [Alphaproteobacteria bacterium]
MPKRKPPGGGDVSVGRDKTVKLKRGRGRKVSSRRWLERQLNDPYVAEAKRRGYRSRAAFKLLELDEKYGFLAKGQRVVDLGAAPGGWTQVALDAVGPKGTVVAIDITPIEPIGDAVILTGDVRDAETEDHLFHALGGRADIVLSDMAASSTGHAPTDHLRIVALIETALDFAEAVLAPKGVFVAKVLQGGTERDLLARLRQLFAKVNHAKPASSRKESAEMYVIATGYRGDPDSRPE